MNKTERLRRVLELVSEGRSVSVEQAVEELAVSPATARRDFDALAERGQVRRIHGGVTANVVSFDMPLWQKRSYNHAEKEAVARWCVGLLEPGGSVGLTGGSTVGVLAEQILTWANSQQVAGATLAAPVLTVVTNAIDIAYLMANSPNIRIVVIGGVLNHKSMEATGPLGTETLQKLSLDFAFLGVNGFDANGPGTVDEYEGTTNRLMASRAKQPIIVMDSSKLGRRSFYSLGGPEVVDTVAVDSSVTPEHLERLHDLGYTVHVADPE